MYNIYERQLEIYILTGYLIILGNDFFKKNSFEGVLELYFIDTSEFLKDWD